MEPVVVAAQAGSGLGQPDRVLMVTLAIHRMGRGPACGAGRSWLCSGEMPDNSPQNLESAK